MSTTRAIRDAMKVAINLGLTYLWVDALCIIQDSNQSNIPSVPSADHGFLEVRTVPKRETFKIPYRPSQDQFSIISIQEHEQYDGLKEPVNKRAWALQE